MESLHQQPGCECKRLIYKRGCQEHSSPSTGSAVFIRDIQPLVTTEEANLGSCPWVWVCVVPSHQFHFLVATTPISFETIKPCGCTVSTMDLSEARGLVLFRVIRGGIEISQRLNAIGTVYRRLSYSPSNPSVSRTDWPPPEKSNGDGRALHPRRSSGLRF
jgi:hypothetical protein